MKINSVQSVSFYGNAKPIYMTESMKKEVSVLIDKMQKSTKHKASMTNSYSQTSILAGLRMNDTLFRCIDLFHETKPQDIEKKPDCSLLVGNAQIDLNSKTGEIMKYDGDKMQLEDFISLAKNIVSKFVKEFNNDNIVKKQTVSMFGFSSIK